MDKKNQNVNVNCRTSGMNCNEVITEMGWSKDKKISKELNNQIKGHLQNTCSIKGGEGIDYLRLIIELLKNIKKEELPRLYGFISKYYDLN